MNFLLLKNNLCDFQTEFSHLLIPIDAVLHCTIYKLKNMRIVNIILYLVWHSP